MGSNGDMFLYVAFCVATLLAIVLGYVSLEQSARGPDNHRN